MLLTKEHYELMSRFEAEHKHCRLDREDKANWAKGYLYGDGHVNNLFIAYRKGYALGVATGAAAEVARAVAAERQRIAELVENLICPCCHSEAEAEQAAYIAQEILASGADDATGT